MNYISEFKDINDITYTLSVATPPPITTDPNIKNPIVDLKLASPDPFTVTYEGEDILYKPVKYSQATIKTITKEHYPDMYSPIPHNIPVKFMRIDDEQQKYFVVWQGYVTPSAYNQAWDGDYADFEIECIDCLATLKYFKYESENRHIISFYDLVKKIIKKSGGNYRQLYVSNNMDIELEDKNLRSNLLNNLYISENNFFDEDGEGMTYKEVLEQLCQFLNLTCYSEGENIWMIDYDELRAGATTFYVYNLGNDSYELRNLYPAPQRVIYLGDYKSNDNTISLDKVYNKVTVRDSFYTFDTIFPDLWDDKFIHTYPVIGDERTDINVNTFKIKNEGDDSKDNPYLTYTSYIKYIKNDNCTTYSYKKDEPYTAIVNAIPSWNSNVNMITACLMESDVKDGDNQLRNDLSFKKNLGIMVHNAPDTVSKPVFKIDVPLKKDPFLMKDSYLILRGTVTYQNVANIPVSFSTPSQDKDYAKKDLLYLPAEIKYGKYWWQARDDFMGGNWVTEKTITKIPLDYSSQKDMPWYTEPDKKYPYIEHFLNIGFPILNNINWRDGLEGEGYKIPVPKDLSPNDKPSIILYNPQNPAAYFQSSGYSRHIHSVWIENFEIETQVPIWNNDSVSKSKDQDTEYSNVVNEDFVEELSDIEFKICTYDKKKANYSTVFYINKEGSYVPVANLVRGYTGKALISEKHLIERIVNQYSTPSRLLNITIKNSVYILESYSPIKMRTTCILNKIYGSNTEFIINSMTINYENNTVELNLVEKK